MRMICYVFSLVACLVLVSESRSETLSAPAICLIGEHSGFPEADARTTALLICDELRKQGIPVSDPVYRASEKVNIVYRVSLHPLGLKVLVRLSQENPAGSVVVERQILLGSIEEMIPAAPRLVDALVHRKPIEATASVESVVEQEARALRKIPIQTSGEVGVFGIYGLGKDDQGVKPGLKLAGSYERPPYAVTFEIAFAGKIGVDIVEEEIESVEFGFLGLGGRYFFSKQNFSPYVGSGITYMIGAGWGNSLGGYATSGIEGFRLSEYGFRLELRVDKPFSESPTRHIPISLGVSIILPAE